MSATEAFKDSNYRIVCEFLFREARLLDDGKFEQWFELIDKGIHYRLFNLRQTMFNGKTEDDGDRVILMDENYGSLKTRVDQLSTPGYSISENPRSAVRRFVSNIVIESVSEDGVIQVSANALVYRSHGKGHPKLFSMSRVDRLKTVEGGFRILHRVAKLDEPLVTSRNISILF